MRLSRSSTRARAPGARPISTSGDFAAFNEAVADSPIGSTVIHAVYLINTASPDPEISEKSLASLIHALRLGDAIGADGVVLHAGSRKKDPLDEAVARSGELVREALAETESCPVLFENTAGTQGPLGRNFDELAQLVEAAGAGDRIGICIDCCHLFASGYDIVEPEGLSLVVDDLDREVGLDRLRSLHVNDSAVPMGANRDKHANVGEGEMGERGIATFLSEPRFEDLPAVLETPGPDKKGSDFAEVQRAKDLRAGRPRRPLRSQAKARAQVEIGGVADVEERGVEAGVRRAVALEGGLDAELALRERIAGHLDSAEPAVALGRLEAGDVDLTPEHLLHAAHETAPRRTVDVAPEVRAAHPQTVARLDQLVAERPATPALTGW